MLDAGSSLRQAHAARAASIPFPSAATLERSRSSSACSTSGRPDLSARHAYGQGSLHRLGPQQQQAAALRHERLVVRAAVKRGKEKTVVCVKTLVAKPSQVKKVEALCKDIQAFGEGRAANKASGVITFVVHKDRFEENVFHTWERYEGNAALGRHNTSAEVEAFMRNVVPHLEKPIGMILYEWNNGQLGHACVQGGPKGEGGLEDAPGASGMTGGAGYTQTSKTVNLGNFKRGDEGDSWGMNFRFPWQKKKDEKKK